MPMHEEVREAVAEYMDSLLEARIQQRSATPKGRAKSRCYSGDSQIQQFVEAGMAAIEDNSHPTFAKNAATIKRNRVLAYSEKLRQQHRGLTPAPAAQLLYQDVDAPEVKAEEEWEVVQKPVTPAQKQYHWMVWKTGRTPAPSPIPTPQFYRVKSCIPSNQQRAPTTPKTPRSPTPVRPTSAVRPASSVRPPSTARPASKAVANSPSRQCSAKKQQTKRTPAATAVCTRVAPEHIPVNQPRPPPLVKPESRPTSPVRCISPIISEHSPRPPPVSPTNQAGYEIVPSPVITPQPTIQFEINRDHLDHVEIPASPEVQLPATPHQAISPTPAIPASPQPLVAPTPQPADIKMPRDSPVSRNFNNWMNAATEQEKRAVYSMFKSLSKPAVPIQRPRTAGARTRPHSQQIQAVTTFSTNHSQPTQKVTYYYAAPQRRAVAIHGPRSAPPRGFVHSQGFFMNSCGPYKSHFVINPEWVSENKQVQRKVNYNITSARGMRYTSA